MKAILWLLIFLAFNAYAQTDTAVVVGFKGVALGESKEAFQRGHGNFLCYKDKHDDAISYCSLRKARAQATYANVDVELIVASFHENVFVSLSVYFDPDVFHRLYDALLARYGEPQKTEVRELTTRLGVKVDSPKAQWKLETARMSISQHAGNINEGRLFLISDSHLRWLYKDHLQKEETRDQDM